MKQLELPLMTGELQLLEVDPFWEELELSPSPKSPHGDNRGEDVVRPREKYWDIKAREAIARSAPEQVHGVREQVIPDTSTPLQPSNYVREQVLKSAPEHTHWVEEYWVSRCSKKHKYYRYCYMEVRKIHHHHIGGGNISSPAAIAKKAEVEQAIALKKTPSEIRELIAVFKN